MVIEVYHKMVEVKMLDTEIVVLMVKDSLPDWKVFGSFLDEIVCKLY